MKEDRIESIQSFRELVDDLENLSRLREAFPLLRPTLKALGVDVDGIQETMDSADLPALRRQVEELVTTPDRFNELFASRGWIMYESMNLEVAKGAVSKAKEGDIHGAEADLVAYYDPETVRFLLGRMQAVEAFRPRMRLARKALDDYEAERYHACTPVILALTDGLVNEVHAKVHGSARGLSAADADLEAWDSIAGHSKGLEQLAHLFRKGRRRTRTEEISIPYRHGILHGMDLGYDNKTVAAKAWAALFAVREWALKAEHGELDEPPEGPKPSLADTIARYRRTQEMKRSLAEWKPRSLTVGEEIPADGEPDDYESGSPERRLVEFLSYWRAQNYGKMADCLKWVGSGDAVYPGDVRSRFEDLELQAFKLESVEDGGAAMTDAVTWLQVNRFGETKEERKKVRLVRINERGSPAIRDVEDGEWTIGNWAVFFGPGDWV